MEKIGIMGGTFNPIHLSHIMIAGRALEYLKLDKILFMPSKLPAHKDNDELVSEKDRNAMVKMAIKDYPGFEFSDYEMKRDGYTYTADTIEHLTHENPDVRYYFILGGDSLAQFEKWHRPEYILEHCALVCAPRISDAVGLKGNNEEFIKIAKHLVEKFTRKRDNGSVFVPEIHFIPGPLVSISSSDVRNHIKCGMSITGMVPAGVDGYIAENGLYTDAFFESIKQDLQKTLTPKRYKHVINVAETAFKLALSYGVDPVKAYMAGLLHDCAKFYSDEEILKEAEKYGIVPEPAELATPCNLLHSKVGSFIAAEKYCIEERDILDAIYYHTTGRPGMSILEEIIYAADILEPGRDMAYTPSLDILRSEASYDLDMVVYQLLENVVPYLKEKCKDSICTMTLDTYEYYKKLISDRNK
ncbi:MAG: nicotinate-nucleotide adenylyltransferase [Lachnospiraceae bacterium]|nr:nicotinate-nucleotide adenylyltransferase [Lachnospiraceae bacterium]